MRPIQRSPCPDRQQSSAVYLATMIDERTRDYGLSSARSEKNATCLGTSMHRPDASVLIWVESDDELIREQIAGRHRGMMMVAHGSGHGTADGSFIISYPIATDDHTQHVPAVSCVLEAMGWSVVASRSGQAAGEHLNTAVLASTARSGPQHRLWLAEPVGAAQDQGVPPYAQSPGRSAALAIGDFRAREIRGQLEAWVNEGGAGDDVAS